MSRASEYLEKYAEAQRFRQAVIHEGAQGFEAVLHGSGLVAINQGENTILLDAEALAVLREWFGRTFRE
jgi:hypothetical protein